MLQRRAGRDRVGIPAEVDSWMVKSPVHKMDAAGCFRNLSVNCHRSDVLLVECQQNVLSRF